MDTGRWWNSSEVVGLALVLSLVAFACAAVYAVYQHSRPSEQPVVLYKEDWTCSRYEVTGDGIEVRCVRWEARP